MKRHEEEERRAEERHAEVMKGYAERKRKREEEMLAREKRYEEEIAAARLELLRVTLDRKARKAGESSTDDDSPYESEDDSPYESADDSPYESDDDSRDECGSAVSCDGSSSEPTDDPPGPEVASDDATVHEDSVSADSASSGSLEEP